MIFSLFDGSGTGNISHFAELYKDCPKSFRKEHAKPDCPKSNNNQCVILPHFLHYFAFRGLQLQYMVVLVKHNIPVQVMFQLKQLGVGGTTIGWYTNSKFFNLLLHQAPDKEYLAVLLYAATRNSEFIEEKKKVQKSCCLNKHLARIPR